jgi:hypothetical protein
MFKAITCIALLACSLSSQAAVDIPTSTPTIIDSQKQANGCNVNQYMDIKSQNCKCSYGHEGDETTSCISAVIECPLDTGKIEMDCLCNGVILSASANDKCPIVNQKS